MFCCDSSTGEVLAHPEMTRVPVPPLAGQAPIASGEQFAVTEPESGVLQYALRLPTTDGSCLVAMGYALSSSDVQPVEVVMAAAESDWSQADFDAWLESTPHISRTLLERMLTLAVGELDHGELESSMLLEVEELTHQLQQTYEEISLLHSLTHNMQISRTPLELAEICVDRIESIIASVGTAVWIEQDDEDGRSVLVKGDLPFDETGMARLISEFELHDWSRPVVKNNIQGTLLGSDFPGLESLVIVPIAEGSNRSGWILSCNRQDGEEFGTVEANLLHSLATILGTHVRNIDLYEQHQELLIGFVRSLVSTLDAKDPYTRGHSERVALIGRRLGEEFNLPEEDLHNIYLSGLLHDIGKIGVDDQILQKPGKLTDEEYRAIQEHPMMGYKILKELRNLHQVLPGVRNHHESYNGKGYPDGLAGEEIPLMARILAVADSFDAMGSDRPYRQGMPTEKIEEIFERGSGEQWDARVINSYFAAREDIRNICESYSMSSCFVVPAGQMKKD
ncbi:MAG: HD-GYP domain-containing protein [Planctomycetaceae bacterium]|nr:HD-GYP domain-containing protein [Planctomycetaceae bacterium]MBT6155072.1 HD-GYP domain-containing protein [Planctomycetaceae bacterium]MBT6496157.1 HD-GYP domain-containing protein [Planctomycetaceae bacterium]